MADFAQTSDCRLIGSEIKFGCKFYRLGTDALKLCSTRE